MFSDIKKYISGNFTRNIIMITGGTAFSQLLNMLVSPLITRLYSPEEYGVLSVYIAVLTTLGVLGSFNYEMGIPIAKGKIEAINTFALSIIILLTSTIILFISSIFWGEKLLIALDASSLIDFIYLLPLGILLKGLYNIYLQWAYREKNFKVITKTKFSQSSFTNLTKVIYGLLSNGPLGLILGQILGESSGIITLVYAQLKKNKNLFESISLNQVRKMAIRYKDFPLFTTPRRYIGDITMAIPVIFLTSIYGSEVVGFYGLANSIIQLPMNLVGNSIGNVYYAECASLLNNNPDGIKTLSNKLLKVLIIMGIIPFAILFIFGPQLFALVFGSSWSEAGIYARLLSVLVFARFTFKPISNIFDIFEKQKFSLFINILRLLFVSISFGVSYFLKLNSYWAVSLYSIAMALIYYVQYLGAQNVIKNAVHSSEKKDYV